MLQFASKTLDPKHSAIEDSAAAVSGKSSVVDSLPIDSHAGAPPKVAPRTSGPISHGGGALKGRYAFASKGLIFTYLLLLIDD